MLIGLPESYPSPSALPFNRQSLDRYFQLSTSAQDPGDDGVWLVLQGQSVLTTNGGNGPELPAGKPPVDTRNQSPLYIGNWQGRPCRILLIDKDSKLPAGLESHSLMAREPQIPLAVLSLAGVGLMILHWERSSRYCGQCGEELTRLVGEWGKECRRCKSRHFPRIHPCVIGLIVKGDEILLVRKSEWADGRYGLVAGFVEFGESLEEAMARETAEETGIQITNIRYIGSQCWPFPSQLMCGFVADYVSGEIVIQEDELAEAGWYKLAQLPTIPPRRSIARYLIDQAAEHLSS